METSVTPRFLDASSPSMRVDQEPAQSNSASIETRGSVSLVHVITIWRAQPSNRCTADLRTPEPNNQNDQLEPP